MKILFITPVIPTETDGRRPFNFLSALSGQHEIHLLCMRMRVQQDSDVKRLQKMGIKVTALPIHKLRSLFNCFIGLILGKPLRTSWCRSTAFRRLVQTTCREETFDIVHIDRMRMGQYADEIPYPVVIDFTDSLLLYLSRSLHYRQSLGERLIDMWEKATIPREESRIINKVDVSLFCSKIDEQYFKEHHPFANTSVIFNAVDVRQFTIKSHQENHQPQCIITGTLFYFPNVDSVLYYAKSILPLVHSSFPWLGTRVIGTRPIRVVNDLDGSQKIQILPNVPCMNEYLFSDDIYVCPLRVAAGIRNKLLEAMAAGMPVVTTRLGAEGLDVKHGREVLFAESPQDFLECIKKIINDDQIQKDLSVNARRFVEEKHSQDVLFKKITNLYSRVI